MKGKRDRMAETKADVLLQMRGICKHFTGVQALDKVGLVLRRSEVLGLIGENGAGKSTLMKVLMGIEQPDSGEIELRGRKVIIPDARAAYHLGIGMVFQEQALLPNMCVYENIFMGHEDEFVKFGWLDKRTMIKEAEAVLQDAHVDVSPMCLLADLTYAQRQMIEIARSFYLTRKFDDQIIIILDEPTTVLSDKEITQLFKTIDKLNDRASFILISHDIEEVKRFCSRIVIMKDGVNTGELDSADADVNRIQELMVGREFASNYYLEDIQRDPAEETVLEVKGLCADRLKDVDFAIKRGEIVGLAGLLGCGKDTLLRVIFGDEAPTSGTIHVNGKQEAIQRIQDAIALRMGYLPSDRRNDSVFGGLSIRDNFNVVILDQYLRGPFINSKIEHEHANEYLSRLKVKMPSASVNLETLSGGNQQKVVIARWLAKEPMLLMIDQPTRGVDVGAKQEIYRIMRELAAHGVSILFSSDELNEVIGLSNRVLVLKNGEITARLDSPKNAKPEEQQVICYM